ncbi:nitric oxide synthase [Pseudomonas sp. WN033]|nr:nitric oxide synthase [Pseudomonas sp. WN033]
MKILVIYGTETGNAEMVADDLVNALSQDFESSGHDMAHFDPATIATDDVLIVVCSTYGDGELPNSAQPFFQHLDSQAPDLTGVRFATFGLGDSFYETFNRGSQIIADKLATLGACEFGQRGVHDASSGELPGEIALSWLKQTLAEL